MSLALKIKEEALAAGFDLVGIAPPDALADLEFAREWSERGYAGEMHYLSNPKRASLRSILPEVRSVVCVGLLYHTPYPYSTEAVPQRERTESPLSPQAVTTPRAWISRYAWGRDYHDVMRAKLEHLRSAIIALSPQAGTRVYVDTGPVVERAFARLSGIGWVGKNTCLINQGQGSWFFLGVILTTIDVAPDLPAPDRCGTCRRCLDACPTGALVEPYVMDASRCISYFTIELKGSIPIEFRASIGANLFGCDICQDVCPWNKPLVMDDPRAAESSTAADDQSQAGQSSSKSGGHTAGNGLRSSFEPLRVTSGGGEFSLFNPSMEDLLSLTEADFRQAFAHSPVKRAKYRGWLRNLCVVMGNSGDLRFVPWLERALDYPDEVVREHAQWALAQIKSGQEPKESAGEHGRML
jgi:epoxyqueuosine reductase